MFNEKMCFRYYRRLLKSIANIPVCNCVREKKANIPERNLYKILTMLYNVIYVIDSELQYNN